MSPLKIMYSHRAPLPDPEPVPADEPSPVDMPPPDHDPE